MYTRPAVGLYFHIPFCVAKCSYCDFNSYANLRHLFLAYSQALLAELGEAFSTWEFDVKTVYIGGGTPTVLPVQTIQDVLAATKRKTLDIEEVTTEANPGTLTPGYLKALRAAGINRISLGLQSMNDKELRLLGRIHNSQEALSSIDLIRASGFKNLNLDLMYGLPEQTLSSWEKTLDRALSVHPDHLSLYALTIEPDTPLATSIEKGFIQRADDDLSADMYELSEEKLRLAGYVHYEISNWALPGRECRHNLIYWRNEPYLGIGAGAWSYWQGRRWGNIRSPWLYISQIEANRSVVEECEGISPTQAISDTLILGLRLSGGVRWNDFSERFGLDMKQVYGREIEQLERLALLEVDPLGIRLTSKGRLLGNEVFEKFLEKLQEGRSLSRSTSSTSTE